MTEDQTRLGVPRPAAPPKPLVVNERNPARSGKESIMVLQYRQGDVYLAKIEGPVPPTAQPVVPDQGRVILAYGEVTGHAHSLSPAQATLYAELEQTDRWLVVAGPAPAPLTHEEHGAILVEPGVYRVRRQREYQPDAVRWVA